MEKRIDVIRKYTKAKTEEFISKNLLEENNGINALDCSLDLKLDRANVSKYLNILWKNGELIKIQGKPVYYLHYQTLVFNYPNNFFPSFINIGDSINKYISTNQEPEINNRPVEEIEISNIDPFSSLIGANGSLLEVISYAKSAVAYPPYGIPTIICGNIGVGKTVLANCMYEFAKQCFNKDIPFQTIYSQSFQNDSHSFSDVLLGSDNKSKSKHVDGILDKCINGILLVDQVETLSVANQMLLSLIIQKNKYQSINSVQPKKLKTMIILTTNLEENDPSISCLTNATPIHLKLMDIDYRGVYEKIELIMALLIQEAKTTNINIRVPKDIISLLALHRYQNNIAELHNEIKLACSRAFLNTSNPQNKTIFLSYDCLSINILSQTQNSSINNGTIVSLLSCIPDNYLLFESDGTSEAADTLSKAPDIFKDHRMSQFVGEFNVDIDELDSIDNYVRENINILKDCPEAQLNSLKTAINPYVMQVVLKEIQNLSEYNLLHANLQLLYGILVHISNYLKRVEYNDNIELDEETSVTQDIYIKEYVLAKDIYTTLSSAYSFKPTNREIDFLASYLAIANQWVNRATVSILVICHGDSIASQMVNYIKNNIDENYTIDAIDYKPNMQFNDLLELARLRAVKINNGVGVLVACDMEPLTSISNYIYNETDIPSLSIANITLPRLIELAKQSASAINDLDSLVSNNTETNKFQEKVNESSEETSLIEQIRVKIISNIVSFIDTKKATDLLLVSLKNILKEINIPYDESIAIKYICHCTNMLERVIKNDTWDYRKLNRFYKQNSDLVHVVEKNLEYVGNGFNVVIPSNEIAYVCEIFLPGILGE